MPKECSELDEAIGALEASMGSASYTGMTREGLLKKMQMKWGGVVTGEIDPSPAPSRNDGPQSSGACLEWINSSMINKDAETVQTSAGIDTLEKKVKVLSEQVAILWALLPKKSTSKDKKEILDGVDD